MIVEYAGLADRWAGHGQVHNVRAWWNVNSDDEGAVRQEAIRLVKAEVSSPHVTFEDWGMDTSTHPTINAFMRIRVIGPERHAEVQRLRKVVVRACAFCNSPDPCNYLRMPDGEEKAACYTCLRGPSLAEANYRTVAWVKADGTLQV